MIVEYIRYAIGPGRSEDFESAYAAAGTALTSSEHCLGWELSRGIEAPDQYIVRIEWDSVEGHEQGFRSSPAFAAFFSHVQPFTAAIEEMRHYAPTAVTSAEGR